MRVYNFSYLYRNKRTYLPDNFFIRDMSGDIVKVKSSIPIIENKNKKTEKYWSVKKLKSHFLWSFLISYNGDKQNAFRYFFWVLNVPLNFSHYDQGKGMLAYFSLFLFNRLFPNQTVHVMSITKIIITDKPYITKFSTIALNDVLFDSQEAIKNLEALI